MPIKFTLRNVFFLIFAGSIALILAGLVVQVVKEVEPNLLCVLQRYGLVLCGLVALCGALHNSQDLGRRVYGVLVLLSIALTGYAALAQIHLQEHPEMDNPCSDHLQWLVGKLPFSESLPSLFHGHAGCTTPPWTVLGVSGAGWTLSGLFVLALLALWQTARKTPERRRFG